MARHVTSGPLGQIPLSVRTNATFDHRRSFIFAAVDNNSDRLQKYAEQTALALAELIEQFPGLSSMCK